MNTGLTDDPERYEERARVLCRQAGAEETAVPFQREPDESETCILHPEKNGDAGGKPDGTIGVLDATGKRSMIASSGAAS